MIFYFTNTCNRSPRRQLSISPRRHANQDQDRGERAPSAQHTPACCHRDPLATCSSPHPWQQKYSWIYSKMDPQPIWEEKKPSATPVLGLVYQVETERLTPTSGRTAGREGLLIFTATTAKAQPKARKTSCKSWGFQLSERLLHSQQHTPHWMVM